MELVRPFPHGKQPLVLPYAGALAEELVVGKTLQGSEVEPRGEVGHVAVGPAVVVPEDGSRGPLLDLLAAADARDAIWRGDNATVNHVRPPCSRARTRSRGDRSLPRAARAPP